jgi:beta-carotene 3-hydroxylase
MLLVDVLVFVASFGAMEAVSAATHRWVMHRAGMRWHRSHHAPSTGGWEANDLFPLMFSLIGFGVFLAAWLARANILYWIGSGIAAYGVAYLIVHEIFIHRRIDVHVPESRFVQWLRRSHGVHHAFGRAPYGMLLPVVPKDLRRDPAEAPAELDRRASTRSTRQRL